MYIFVTKKYEFNHIALSDFCKFSGRCVTASRKSCQRVACFDLVISSASSRVTLYTV